MRIQHYGDIIFFLSVMNIFILLVEYCSESWYNFDNYNNYFVIIETVLYAVIVWIQYAHMGLIIA